MSEALVAAKLSGEQIETRPYWTSGLVWRHGARASNFRALHFVRAYNHHCVLEYLNHQVKKHSTRPPMPNSGLSPFSSMTMQEIVGRFLPIWGKLRVENELRHVVQSNPLRQQQRWQFYRNEYYSGARLISNSAHFWWRSAILLNRISCVVNWMLRGVITDTSVGPRGFRVGIFRRFACPSKINNKFFQNKLFRFRVISIRMLST